MARCARVVGAVAVLALALYVGFRSPRGVGRRRFGGGGAANRRLQTNTSLARPMCPAASKKCAEDKQEGWPLWVTLPVCFVLVCFSALFSGLTLGLMGLDILGLQIVQKGENAELAQYASKIAPIRESGNQLLCTLLLGNVAVNSGLSIFMADLASGTVGFLVSTGLIVIFGEIVPQAACSRYALYIGARTVPLVQVLMGVFWVITKPMSLALDRILGQDVGTVHSRKELMEMLKIQISLGALDKASGDIAKQVAEGALSFRDKLVQEVMTPLEDSYMLPADTKLDFTTIREIFQTGFSRIPVYHRDKHDYKGLLYTKDLMLADPEDAMKLGDFIAIFNRRVETFFKETKLLNVLNAFKNSGTHMGLVRDTNVEDATDPRFEICGVLTLEDVIEEILQEEIVDETDVYVDVDNHVKVCDGRELACINLGVFTPAMKDRLSFEEVYAIAAHLERTIFRPGTELELSTEAIEWFVFNSQAQNRTRSSTAGSRTPDDCDCLYTRGTPTETSILVLQGRVRLRVGQDNLGSEAGSFSVIAKDALESRTYVPDFSAYVGTVKVRLLLMSKEKFTIAKGLELEPHKLTESLSALKEQEPRSPGRSETSNSKRSRSFAFN